MKQPRDNGFYNYYVASTGQHNQGQQRTMKTPLHQTVTLIFKDVDPN